MLRRWGILLGMLTLLAGLAVATTGSASAGTMGFRPGGPIHLVGSAAAVPNARGGIRHQAESTNWSGYAATTGTYTSISASWTEPTGTCSGSRKYSSFWVGLDGFNSNSVEQTGSEVDCSGRTAIYYSWYEMFPAAPVNYTNTVRRGDHRGTVVQLRRAAAGQLRHRHLQRVRGQRHVAGQPGADPDHHGQQQRRGQGLDQRDQLRRRV